MRGSSNIVSAIHSLKMADDHFNSFQLEHKGSAGDRLFKTYREKINFIFWDLVCHPFLPESVRQGIKNEINSDVFAVPALQEKIPLLPPEQREMVELIIDRLLAGEELSFAKEENY